MLLTSMFDSASFISPSLKRFRLSRVKVEKVVKPPSIPIKIKCLMFEEKLSISKRPQRRPITNDPERFTINVPQGNIPLTSL